MNNEMTQQERRLWLIDALLAEDSRYNQLLGCFHPCHGCIDNAIHSAAGLELRQACADLMAAQGHPEPCGQAKLTPAFNLPSRFVLHTVGPIVRGLLTSTHKAQLASCYESCLTLAESCLTPAEKHSLKSLAFCCISCGEYGFPADEAALIAYAIVRDYLRTTSRSALQTLGVPTASATCIAAAFTPTRRWKNTGPGGRGPSG